MAKKQAIRQDPAYQLYTSDFLVRNADLSDEQAGQFIRLLCMQHQNGHLTEATLLSFCKGKKDELIFSRFRLNDKGLYYNEEMDNEINRRHEICETNRENIEEYWKKKKLKEGEKEADLKKEKNSVNTHIPEYEADS
jgi:hypothetical protein